MNWLGDYPEDFTTVCIYFTTHDNNGAPVAPLTAFEAADVTIYKNGSATQKTSTNGMTMTSPFDSIVGLHCLVIDTSNDTGDSGFWTTGGGGVYTAILNPDTETVNGQTVLKVIGTFGICLSPALRPTSAGRTLDVTATGAAGIDWGNIENLTTVNALSSTTIATTQKVDIETIKTNPVVNGGTVTFPTNSTVATTTGAVGSVTGAVGSVTGFTASDVGTIKTKTDFLPSATAGAAGGVFIAGTNAATTVTTSFTSTFTGNLTGTIGGLTAAALKDFFDTDTTTTYASAVAGSVVKEIVTNSGGTPPTAAAIADAVWDEALSGHLTAGSAGEALDNAGSGGSVPTAGEIADAVWDEALSGHAVSGSSGEALTSAAVGGSAPSASEIADEVETRTIAAVTLVNGLSAGTITSVQSGLATSSSITTLQTSVDDVPTNAELATALAAADDATLAAIAALTAPDNASIAAIKAKTDSLTFTIAGEVAANVTAVNSVSVTGTGAVGDRWGPA